MPESTRQCSQVRVVRLSFQEGGATGEKEGVNEEQDAGGGLGREGGREVEVCQYV